VKIGTLDVGPGHPCAIVAEIGNAHNGSYSRALRLLEAAQACGASAAKLQVYTPDELIALRGDGPAPAQWGEQGWTMRSLYEKARTPLAWVEELYKFAASIELPLFSSVFGPDSLATLEDAGNPVYKIAKPERNATALLRAVADTGKPVIVSATKPRVRRGAGTRRIHPDATLYCPGSYPCDAKDVRLPRSFHLRHPITHASGFLGLSSHCLDPRLPIAAVARGAKMLEYHFMLDDEPSELEANVSLGEAAFARMVADVRATEVLLGER
jgi:pseudaminic acid synthase